MHQCNHEEKIQIMSEDIKDIKGDIKTLLSFRSKIIGAIVIGSAFVSTVITFIMRG